MAKWCLNYENGEYEYIERDGFSITSGEYVAFWDDSEYVREEEEEKRREEEFDNDDLFRDDDFSDDNDFSL